jgi:hypothetical protein
MIIEVLDNFLQQQCEPGISNEVNGDGEISFDAIHPFDEGYGFYVDIQGQRFKVTIEEEK